MHPGKIVTLCLLVPLLALAGAVDTAWVRFYDGPTSTQINQAADIYVDAAGYIYVCGSGEQNYPGASDMLIAKFTPQGDTLWVKAIGGNTLSQDDMAHALAVDASGNVYVAGVTGNVPPRGYDVTWAKLSPGGSYTWVKKTAWPGDDAAFDMVLAGDTALYLCGTDGRNDTLPGAFLVMRVSPATGDTVWTRSFILDDSAFGKRGSRDLHPSFFDEYDYWDNCAVDMAITPDGKIAVTGMGVELDLEREWWTMKMTPAGDTLWTSTYHNPLTIFHDDDVSFSVAAASNGNIYACGFDYYETGISLQGYNYAVVCYDSLGNRLAYRSINVGAEDGDDAATSLVLDDSTPQNVYVTGYLAYPIPVNDQVATFKYSPSLNSRWGVAGALHGAEGDQRGYKVIYRNNRVYVVGQDELDLVALAYTPANPPTGVPKDTLWTYTYDSPDSLEDLACAIAVPDTARMYVAGDCQRAGSGYRMFLARLYYPARDIALNAILAPMGTLSYLDTVTPRIRVINQGQGDARFDALMRIGSSYVDTVRFPGGLAPGDTTELTFDDWLAQPVGNVTVRCTVAQYGDLDPSDNAITDTVTVVYHDVGCPRIVAPVGSVDSGVTVTPRAWLRNYAAVPDTFDARFTIGSFYTDTQRVTLAPGESLLKSFDNWTVRQRGRWLVACSTMLRIDGARANDRAYDTIAVTSFDVGVTRIISPPNELDSGTRVVPVARVRNFGSLPGTFPVCFRIGSFYADTVNIANLMPGESTVVVFDTWTAVQRNSHIARCSTALPGDLNTGNDSRSAVVTVYVIDASVISLRAPGPEIDSGLPVAPSVWARNKGNVPGDVPVWFRIWRDTSAAFAALLRIAAADLPAAPRSLELVYSDSATTYLSVGDSALVLFRPWLPTELDTFALQSFTALAGDMRPENDTLPGRTVVTRQRGDVGATTILAPVGQVDSGTTHTPRATVENFWIVPATFAVRFTIGSLYSDDTTVTVESHQLITVDFAAWTATEVGTIRTRCSTMLANDRNPANDIVTDSVTVTPPQGVEEILSVPGRFYAEPAGPNPFATGTALAYGLPVTAAVELEVYDAIGTLVRTLESSVRPAGVHHVAWDGRDEAGRRLAPGVYYYRFAAGQYRSVRKLIKLE